jgi:hypothetical protein
MLVGAAIAGFLLWLGAQLEGTNVAGYWALIGLAAAAGLVLALSQIAGGWTKWGAPRVTGAAFLLGFLPALLVGGWVLLASQPEGAWMQSTAANWAQQLALGGVLETLAPVLPVIGFVLGLLFGYTFDTTGAKIVAADPAPANDAARPVDDDVRDARTDRDVRTTDREERHADERDAEDEPVTAERETVRARDGDRDRWERDEGEYHEPDREFVSAIAGDRSADRDADRVEGDREQARAEERDDRGESRRGWFGRR